MKKVKFNNTNTHFSKVLKEKINHYFKSNNIQKTGESKILWKAILLFVLLLLTYLILLIVQPHWADSLRDASLGFKRLNESFERVTQDLSKIGNTSTDTSNYQDQINKLSTNLQQLNVVYEQELTQSGTKLQGISKEFEKVGETFRQFNASAEGTQQLRDQIQDLNRNLAALNQVYANMLAAMNQSRG